jgi:hypothetical protein
MKLKILVLAIAVLSMLGCADTKRRLQNEEEALNTDGSITRLFHSVLYFPFETAPRFDGYLVGIEKVRRPETGVNVRNRAEYGLKDSSLQAKFDDSKVMAVTHVIRHHADARHHGNCTLFNAYVQSPESAARQLVPACNSRTQPEVIRNPSQAFSNSWEALDALGSDMEQRIASRHADSASTQVGGPTTSDPGGGAPYTHIVVVVMGWNTVQEEAVRNINSLVWNMERAHDERAESNGGCCQPRPEPAFNPLVIGVTWPSQWSSDWLDPLVKIVSFPTKAGDADEVGMSWLGVLLHETLAKVRLTSGLPVVVLGHSFGAKASSVATCAGPAVVRSRGAASIPLAKVDVLVNLEPAYLAERIFGRTSLLQNVVYPRGCPQANRFVITASASDTAVPLPFWGAYLGEGKSYKHFCELDDEHPRLASCAIARADGHLDRRTSGTSNIYYVEASRLISENAYGTGGGSHSDIYRLEHGRLVYSAVMGEDLWATPAR